MRHVAEQLVELPNRLLNIAYLRLALDDEGFLEVDLVLRGETELLLLLERAARGARARWRCGAASAFLLLLVEGSAVRGRGLAFAVERRALEVLEFLEGGLEFAVQL